MRKEVGTEYIKKTVKRAEVATGPVTEALIRIWPSLGVPFFVGSIESRYNNHYSHCEAF